MLDKIDFLAYLVAFGDIIYLKMIKYTFSALQSFVAMVTKSP